MINSLQLKQAARLIRAGGIIAYPTEAVYGLGCDPLNPQAVRRLLAIKGRAVEKGVILVAADFDQLRPFVGELDSERMVEVLASWPGPVTWLLPVAPQVPDWLTGGRDTLAVRVTAHRQTAALCRAAGMPLVSTSANQSGRPAARSALQVRLHCPGADLILPGATDKRARPSEIRDARSGKLLRAG